MRFAEFASWDTPACQSWLAQGHAAILPCLIARKGGGESRYLVTPYRAAFLAACKALDATPSDLPKDRCSINIDGENLLRALFLARHGSVPRVFGDERPWDKRCPECGMPFNHVAAHQSRAAGDALDLTQAGCINGHRWPV